MIYNPDFTFKCGDRFIKKGVVSDEYLLCEGGYDVHNNKVRVLLVNLETGIRWNNGVLMQFPDWITMDEFVKIASSNEDVRDLEKFEQI